MQRRRNQLLIVLPRVAYVKYKFFLDGKLFECLYALGWLYFESIYVSVEQKKRTTLGESGKCLSRICCFSFRCFFCYLIGSHCGGLKKATPGLPRWQSCWKLRLCPGISPTQSLAVLCSKLQHPEHTLNPVDLTWLFPCFCSLGLEQETSHCTKDPTQGETRFQL